MNRIFWLFLAVLVVCFIAVELMLEAPPAQKGGPVSITGSQKPKPEPSKTAHGPAASATREGAGKSQPKFPRPKESPDLSNADALKNKDHSTRLAPSDDSSPDEELTREASPRIKAGKPAERLAAPPKAPGYIRGNPGRPPAEVDSEDHSEAEEDSDSLEEDESLPEDEGPADEEEDPSVDLEDEPADTEIEEMSDDNLSPPEEESAFEESQVEEETPITEEDSPTDEEVEVVIENESTE
jgi:hypothetical protein